MNISNIYIITVFKNILNDNIIHSFINFIVSVNDDKDLNDNLKLYSDFVYKLYKADKNANLYNYIKRLLQTDCNVLSVNYKDIMESDFIFKSAIFELNVFDELIKYDYKTIKSILLDKYPNSKNIIENLPMFNCNYNQPFDIYELINSYRNNGWGIFVYNKAFQYTSKKEIIPVEHFKAMTFKDLKNYEYQQAVILRNTKAFVEGKEANNILLYGDRGCGKSSTVKALINEFESYNLKIIQITKESFIYLSDLYDKLRTLPNKFIIFADDISFEENDKEFSTIKAVLEGSLSDKPENTIIYATTNRMHLVKESYTSREGSELHINDTIDETVSLSDRFGIMLTFSSLTKTEYLDIVKQIAQDLDIQINDKLYRKAEMFAALKAIRTPRVARQFITDYINE